MKYIVKEEHYTLLFSQTHKTSKHQSKNLGLIHKISFLNISTLTFIIKTKIKNLSWLFLSNIIKHFIKLSFYFIRKTYWCKNSKDGATSSGAATKIHLFSAKSLFSLIWIEIEHSLLKPQLPWIVELDTIATSVR